MEQSIIKNIRYCKMLDVGCYRNSAIRWVTRWKAQEEETMRAY